MESLSSCDAVLIVGNGFDMNSGLKTSYKDVYESYMRIMMDSLSLRRR